MNVNHSTRPGVIIGLSFRIFNMKVCCVISLESPHRGNSNEFTQHTIISIKRKSSELIPNTILSAAMELFSKGRKNEFEIAVV